MIHALKTEHEFYKAVVSGEKTFEVRKNDRDFKVDDYIALNELDDTREGYTRRAVLLKITYILDDNRYCKEGYVVIGFRKAFISDSPLNGGWDFEV